MHYTRVWQWLSAILRPAEQDVSPLHARIDPHNTGWCSADAGQRSEQKLTIEEEVEEPEPELVTDTIAVEEGPPPPPPFARKSQQRRRAKSDRRVHQRPRQSPAPRIRAVPCASAAARLQSGCVYSAGINTLY